MISASEGSRAEGIDEDRFIEQVSIALVVSCFGSIPDRRASEFGAEESRFFVRLVTFKGHVSCIGSACQKKVKKRRWGGINNKKQTSRAHLIEWIR